MEKFVVKHYSSEDRPIIKGNGFDGLEIGETREEAEEFIRFVNNLMDQLQYQTDRADANWRALCECRGEED